MKYWLTTHWPPREDDDDPGIKGVYVPDGRQRAAADLREGDHVFIYQSKTGRTQVRRDVAGAERRVHCKRGKEGVIALVRATGPIEQYPDSPVDEYTDGTKIWWCWYAPTEDVTQNGFVPRSEVNRALGYSPDYPMRGFGDRNSGLKKLTKDQYDLLLDLFKTNKRKLPEVEAALQASGASHPRVPGGEGLEHKQLKEFVGDDPANALSEEGLSTVKVEHQFSTGDRADIVLEDHVGRIVAVEVEVDVGDDGLVGVLQALKYRAMAELTFKRSQHEGRAFLVAYSISASIRRLCKMYGVECFEVDRKSIRKHSTAK